MNKRKRIIFGVLLCILICCLTAFWPYTPYLPLPEPAALPTDHALMIFGADMLTSQWRTSTHAVFALDVETGRLMKWVPVRWNDDLNSPIDSHRNFIVLRERSRDTTSLVYATGERRALDIEPGYGSLSPDGKSAVTFAQRPTCEMQVIGLSGRHIRGRIRMHPDVCKSNYYFRPIRWSPDGAYLAFVAGIGDRYSTPPSYIETLYLIRDTGVDVHVVYTKTLSGTLDTLSWSPGGDWLAFAQASEDEDGTEYAQLWLVDVEEEDTQAVLPPRQGDRVGYWDMAWSPDGTQLAFTFGSGKAQSPLWVMDVETQAARQLLVPPGEDEYWYGVVSISWAPGDSLMIAASLEEDPMIRCYDIQGSDAHRSCTFNLFEVDSVTGARTQLTYRRFGYLFGGLAWWE